LVTLVVGLIIQGFLPIIEQLFGVVTSMTLIDYSDANQPLLRKLAMEAPGTFSHSLLVGTIAEKAAEEIGVNGLLCRVGAYYHDIGKVNKPDYFFENQMGGSNRHDRLSPTMSKHVIVGHVKDGAEIAKEYKLPAAIRQFIETHHGRTLIKCFYEQAKKQDFSKNGSINEQDYRYPGPFPQTKEAAIVMLADSVEGAVRAMQEPSASRIHSLIHNMAMERLQDGQFDNCDLTLKELSKIVETLAKSLIAHHHARIAYPETKDQKKNNGNSQRLKDRPVDPAPIPECPDLPKDTVEDSDKTDF
jgi:cyclic-di-AMP phosphodiesterase PgpH